jgi:hypothetical protein
MTQISFFGAGGFNFNVYPGLSDPTLAGRVPPLVTGNQLRPNLPNPRKLIESRKYVDNPTMPYVSTYETFNIPIIFETDPIEEAIAASYNTVPIITSVTGRMTNCVLESPLPTDPGGDQLKLNPAGTTLWAITRLQEPFVFGPQPPPFNRMDNIAGVTLGTGSPFVTYNIQGYFTERNFFDREWIVQWKDFFVKVNAFGVFLLKPSLRRHPLSAKDPRDWILITSWTPEEFYQQNIGLARYFDSPLVETFITGARDIIKYEPSKIGSLRYYFTFTTTTQCGPIPFSSIHLANLSVKYNQDLGAERLRWARRRLNVKKLIIPDWLLDFVT